jgi:hypothetical protein
MKQSVVISAFEIVLAFGERMAKLITLDANLLCLWANLDWIVLKEWFTFTWPISILDSSIIALLLLAAFTGYTFEWPNGVTDNSNQIVLGGVITLVNGVHVVSELKSRSVCLSMHGSYNISN